MINTAGQADHAIVLGLALENRKPTDDLLARLNTAQAYLEKYPEAQLILTGATRMSQAARKPPSCAISWLNAVWRMSG